MELVFSHNNMDFDSLAAQYAVCKLHPAAKMVLGYPLVGSVRRFIALHRDNLPIAQAKYLDYSKVKKLYIVDCQHIERIDDGAKKLIEAGCPHSVFDHHENDPDGLSASCDNESVIEFVGSSTTILVDKLRQSSTKLTSFEATLFAIGIYEDTGNLTYAGTTSKDAACVAYLLEQGADLAIVGDFIRPRLSEELTQLLETLIDNSRTLIIGGCKILLSSTTLVSYLDGLATLTRKLCEIESADAAFTVVKMKDRIHVVGRSDSRSLDIRPIVRALGGNGHAGAASAVVRDSSLAAVLAKIEIMLTECIAHEPTAQDVMTSPVRTIKPRTLMQDANRLMLRYGLDGLLVVENKKVVGVVSRRDIEQAAHHKLGHAPVLGFMSKPVLSVAPDTPISEIQKTMIKRDVGRLPVIDSSEHLHGIVSRSDVLKSLYGAEKLDPIIQPDDFNAFTNIAANVNVSDHLAIDLSDKIALLEQEVQDVCNTVGRVAAELNMVAYAVGGFVRDLLLSRPNFDLDFVIEGSAIEMARAVANETNSKFELLAEHERFKTAQLQYLGQQVRKIDFSTARAEFYEYPAALPTVEPSEMQQDLLRRDFTINAMAICLNPDNFGKLLDIFGGLHDLSDKSLRVMHSFSFIEDPTRLVRAARFAARLGFSIESKTMEQAQRAVSLGIFDDLGGVRMRDELRLILESEHRLDGLDLLASTGAKLRYLDSELEYGPSIKKQIRIAGRLLQRYPVSQPWVVYLGVLLAKLSSERLPAVLERLHLTNEQKDIVLSGLGMPAIVPTLFERVEWEEYKLPSRSSVYRMLHGKSDESLAIAASLAVPGSAMRRLIRLYRGELQHQHIQLTGTDLLLLGVTPGPAIGQLLGRILDARLDCKVGTREDEIELVKAQLSLS